MRRSTRILRAHIPTFTYFIALVVASPLIIKTHDPKWLLVHLLFLGVITNLIFFWSLHFTTTLLRRPNPENDRGYWIRIALLNIGIISVIFGRITDHRKILIAGAFLVIASSALHTLIISKEMQRSLPTRFIKVPRFYLAASLFLILGAILGARLSQLSESEHKSALLIAHYCANILGWVGLTVAGTFITFIPTMLRQRLPDRAEKNGYIAFHFLSIGVLVGVSGAVSTSRLMLASGLTLYFVGWFYLLLPHLQIITLSSPISFSIKSIIMANIWLCTGLAVLIFTIATNNSWTVILDRTQSIALIFGIGFALQTVLAALSYLVPSILGGGPAKLRILNEVSSQVGNFRWLLLNFGLFFLTLNWQGAVFIAGVAAVALSLIADIAVFSMLVRRGIKQ